MAKNKTRSFIISILIRCMIKSIKYFSILLAIVNANTDKMLNINRFDLFLKSAIKPMIVKSYHWLLHLKVINSFQSQVKCF